MRLASRGTLGAPLWLASVLCSFVGLGFVSLGACAKNSTDVAPAQAASASAATPGSAGSKAGGEDTTPPQGVDLGQLDEFERKVFFRVVNKEPSACGKAHSLIHSVKNDPGCRKSFYAVRYVARLVDSGYSDSEITDHLQKRFRAGTRKTLDLADAPSKGNPSARVTVVEFVDFECPHCKRVQPVLRQILEDYKNDVRVVFKNYPLGSHTNARLAAEACMAAHKQGKFWPYSDKVWEHSEGLTPAILEQIAKQVGLDVAKWRQDLEAEATKSRVDRDKNEGGALGIQSTPTIYVNGREYTDQRDVESLRDWINEELGR
jgi:thiol-disulfide isomerase/thioredoxin